MISPQEVNIEQNHLYMLRDILTVVLEVPVINCTPMFQLLMISVGYNRVLNVAMDTQYILALIQF